MREAVLKCDAEVQSQILQKGVELLFETTSLHHEEEMDWSTTLVASVIVSLRPSARVPNKQTLLRTLMRAVQSEKPFLITETAAQAVASVLNKWPAASTDEVRHLPSFSISSPCSSFAKQQRLVNHLSLGSQ